MDENYRRQLDAGMTDELAALEQKARAHGDYCKKHDLYIGDATMCPWCEIGALNEKCCPGDLLPSVVMKWPVAARRAMMYFQVEEKKAADEIERLRERIEWLVAALLEIVEGKGAFDRYQLKHASNVIEETIDIARRALEGK
jgi:hypothetical protein